MLSTGQTYYLKATTPNPYSLIYTTQTKQRHMTTGDEVRIIVEQIDNIAH